MLPTFEPELTIRLFVLCSAEVTAVVEVEAVAQPKKLRDRRATAALPSTKSAVEDTPVKERRVRGQA